jgi:putative transposase
MSMLTELRNRGIADVLIVCHNGLKDLADAIRVTWPHATVQTCVVHLVRNRLRYASKKHWQTIARQLRGIYTAPTAHGCRGGLRRVLRGAEAAVPGDDPKLGAVLAGVSCRS